MTIICPSQWLADLTKISFMGCYPIKVIHNRIDLSAFVPTNGDFKEKYQLQEKNVVLGVASSWDWRKGLRDYIALSQKLPEEYVVLVVGLFEKQIRDIRKDLPESRYSKESESVTRYVSDGHADLLCMTKTDNVRQLAELYTLAFVYANLSYEENYPTTNLEAAACGTTVLTYRTGGSPESCKPENVIEVGDLEAVVKRLKELEQQV